MEKVQQRKMGWDKHDEVKLVHELKHEVGSRDELMYTKKSDQWFWEKWMTWVSISSSSKRDEIAQMGWLNFVSKKDQFVLYAFVNYWFKNSSNVWVSTLQDVDDKAWSCISTEHD